MPAATVEFLAPVPGTVLALKDVPDPVFGPAMMGGGGAVQPPVRHGLEIVAPVGGTVLKAKHHAVVIRAAEHVVLVHLGIDTNSLEGLGFSLEAKVGMELAAGQQIGTWDTVTAAENGRSTCTVVVVLDSDPASIRLEPGRKVDAGESLFTLG